MNKILGLSKLHSFNAIEVFSFGMSNNKGVNTIMSNELTIFHDEIIKAIENCFTDEKYSISAVELYVIVEFLVSRTRRSDKIEDVRTAVNKAVNEWDNVFK